MRILLTNDDGVHAPGIKAMYKALVKMGEVTVVAPDGERSSISQAITLSHPVFHRVVPFEGRTKAHAVSGTPADCVKFACAVLMKDKPDLVVSGINDGSNDGCSVFYSGTVGAAREGSLLGIPSLALSLDCREACDFTSAAVWGGKAVRWVINNGLPKGTFLNVNVPDLPRSKIKGLVFASQCRVPIHGRFLKRQGPFGRTYYWLTGRPPAKKHDAATDSFLLQQSYAVAAPIQCDSTDHVFLKTILKERIL
jgi:5'-nucleotidase